MTTCWCLRIPLFFCYIFASCPWDFKFNWFTRCNNFISIQLSTQVIFLFLLLDMFSHLLYTIFYFTLKFMKLSLRLLIYFLRPPSWKHILIFLFQVWTCINWWVNYLRLLLYWFHGLFLLPLFRVISGIRESNNIFNLPHLIINNFLSYF